MFLIGCIYSLVLYNLFIRLGGSRQKLESQVAMALINGIGQGLPLVGFKGKCFVNWNWNWPHKKCVKVSE